MRGRTNGFSLPGCVLPGSGGGRVCLPLNASHGSGAHGGGRPLAAARGCRLLRRFFFLLKTRNVILAGAPQGGTPLRSGGARPPFIGFSPPVWGARGGGEKKKKNPDTTPGARPGRTPRVS